jgi:hypothetical protein
MVVTWAGAHAVVAGAGADQIVAALCQDHIPSATRRDDVTTSGSHNSVVSWRADNRRSVAEARRRGIYRSQSKERHRTDEWNN